MEYFFGGKKRATRGARRVSGNRVLVTALPIGQCQSWLVKSAEGRCWRRVRGAACWCVICRAGVALVEAMRHEATAPWCETLALYVNHGIQIDHGVLVTFIARQIGEWHWWVVNSVEVRSRDRWGVRLASAYGLFYEVGARRWLRLVVGRKE